ncbi:MAG: hypothetical protein FWC40_07395 [Proteobacteria bacterium]|nr:hypothetical protein [Pseudomonadota bacterium]
MTRPVDEVLDASIVCMDLDLGDGEGALPGSGFWRLALVRPDFTVSLPGAPKDVHVEHPVCRDHGAFAEEVARRHVLEESSEGSSYRIPPEVDDQISECTPQFILRNISKLERYHDLSRMLSFNEEALPLESALEALAEVRGARIEPVQFVKLQSVEIVEDFRVFLEEIFYLCPWDQITRRAPDEDSPWHIKHSQAKLVQYLLDRQSTLFIFSEDRTTQIGTKPFVPDDKSSMPPPAFGGSFAPL